MRSLLRGLIHRICSTVASRTAPTSTALVPLYVHNGTFSRVVEHGSEIVRFYNYHCNCGQDTPLTVSEARTTKTRRCGCGKPFNLLRSLDLIEADGRLKAEYEYSLMQLPVKALAVRAPQQRHVEVGNENVRVEWGGPVDRTREAAFERGDPGLMGPSFSSARKN